MPDTLLVIAERDSAWVDWACAWSKPQHTLIVLVLGDESREELCDRMRQRLGRVREGDGRQVVLVAGASWDTPALLERARMVSAILECIATLPSTTRLLLDAGPKDSAAALGMQAIAEAIRECGITASDQLRVVCGANASALVHA